MNSLFIVRSSVVHAPSPMTPLVFRLVVLVEGRAYLVADLSRSVTGCRNPLSISAPSFIAAALLRVTYPDCARRYPGALRAAFIPENAEKP